jgi:SanA protein
MKFLSLVYLKSKYFLWSLPFLIPLATLAAADFYISQSTQNRIYSNIDQIPEKPVALLLGTSKYYQGRINLYYEYRIRAAVELFEKGKVRAILVSGDNSMPDYNEPLEMKQDLVSRGVPAEYIAPDYAGFRTLDSIVRAKQVFGQTALIIVSQEFHCQRAIFIADRYKISAIGYAATDMPLQGGIRVRLREVIARFVAVLDITIFNRQPKYLGVRETILLKQ